MALKAIPAAVGPACVPKAFAKALHGRDEKQLELAESLSEAQAREQNLRLSSMLSILLLSVCAVIDFTCLLNLANLETATCSTQDATAITSSETKLSINPCE